MFEKTGHRDKINFHSVISRVSLLRVKGEDGGRTRKTTLRLPEKEKKRVESLVSRIKQGLQLVLNGASVEVIEKREEVATKMKLNRKRKMDQIKKGVNVKKGKNKLSSKPKKRKVEKSVKTVVDKKNPNWRPKANPSIKVWEKDPLFERHHLN